MDELHPQSLSPDDRKALDALVEGGYDLDRVDPADQPRADAAWRTLRLLDHLPADATGDLLAERTIAAIENARRAEHASQHHAAIGGSAAGRPVRWSEIGAVAAMLIIGLALALPMLARHRAAARQAACQSNLATAGFGFAGYAQENAGDLPAVKHQAGDPWFHHNTFDEVGNTHSNSAHFYLLIRQGHADTQDLACPANANAMLHADQALRDWPNASARSFSFPNMFIRLKPTWQGRLTIPVAVDRNPVFAAASDANATRTAPSPNHAALGGQNVLFNDGSVRWMLQPFLDDGDNIWHIEAMTQGDRPIRYKGTETPDDGNDAFLIP